MNTGGLGTLIQLREPLSGGPEEKTVRLQATTRGEGELKKGEVQEEREKKRRNKEGATSMQQSGRRE